MVKTTVYLPQDLKARLEQEARYRGVSEAEVIRAAVAAALERPRPRGGLFSCDDPMLFGANVDEALKGFGER